MKEYVDDVPIEYTFTSVWYASEYGHDKADEGYKFLLLEIQVRNIGIKETHLFFYRWEVIVDKGYIYEAMTDDLPISLRPEDTKIGHVVFEILATTNPLEVHYFGNAVSTGPTFILDIRNESILTKTACAYESSVISFCSDVIKHSPTIKHNTPSLMEESKSSIVATSRCAC